MGSPSLKSLLGKTLLITFKITSLSQWQRIFNFTSDLDQQNYMFMGNMNSLFRFACRWSGATETTSTSATSIVVGTQYIITMSINTLSTTFILYTWNGTTLTQIHTTTLTYSVGGGTSNPLNILRNLWFGKSSYQDDVYSNGSYQKIVLYNGSSPTIDFPTLFSGTTVTNNTITNNKTGSFYTFGVPSTLFTSLTVQTYNSPTINTTEVSLAGGAGGAGSNSRQYFALTNLPLLEEDTTRMYDASNNILMTLPSANSTSSTLGCQTALISLSLPQNNSKLNIWNALTSGAPSQAQTDAYNGSVKVDATGNVYSISLIDISQYNLNLAVAPLGVNPIIISNTDGTVFDSFYPNTNGSTGVLIKRSPSGQVIWYTKFQATTGLNNAPSIDIDSTGNCYMACVFLGTFTVYDVNNSSVALAQNGGTTTYFAKYNSNGVLKFAFIPIIPASSADVYLYKICL